MRLTTETYIYRLSILWNKTVNTWKITLSTLPEPQIQTSIKHRQPSSKEKQHYEIPLSLSSFLLCKFCSIYSFVSEYFADTYSGTSIMTLIFLSFFFNFTPFSKVSYTRDNFTKYRKVLSTLKFLDNSFGWRSLLPTLWLFLKLLEVFMQPSNYKKIHQNF